MWTSFEDLKIESVRKTTFKYWSLKFISGDELAKAGFYFMGPSDECPDRVQCAYCRGILGDFEAGDDAMTEHRKFFPYCFFVRGKTSDGIDVAGSAIPENSPKHPQFITLEPRIASFKSWAFDIKPQKLAESGFYYTGVSDFIQCFYNGCGLRNLDPTDNVWQLHASLYPTCEFYNFKPKQSNTMLHESQCCKICLDMEREITFLPCAHLITCIACAYTLTFCPICRKDIKQRLRTYLS